MALRAGVLAIAAGHGARARRLTESGVLVLIVAAALWPGEPEWEWTLRQSWWKRATGQKVDLQPELRQNEDP